MLHCDDQLIQNQDIKSCNCLDWNVYCWAHEQPRRGFWHFCEALACSSGSCQKRCQTLRCLLYLGPAPYVSACAAARGRPLCFSTLLSALMVSFQF
ncbi:hypothetical protein MHYP_G00298640 [Metynnis hypsauchen]